MFALKEYITEVRVPEECSFIGMTLGEVEKDTGEKMMIFGFIKKDGKVVTPNRNNLVRAGSRYLVKGGSSGSQGDHGSIRFAIGKGTPLADRQHRGRGCQFHRGGGDAQLPIGGPFPSFSTVAYIELGCLDGRGTAGAAHSKTSWVMWSFVWATCCCCKGAQDNIEEHAASLHLLPLAEREVRVGIFSKITIAVAIFVAAILLSMFKIMPTTLSFLGAILAYVFLGILPLRDLYREIDWPVIVLLGAMIPVSGALQSTGLTGEIATAVNNLTESMPVWSIVALLMVVTMCLSDVINNAATALIMAPIGVGIALQMGVSPDPFLMAVAVGASCAFLTPIGHQCNALILGPGGYRFGDYWRMGCRWRF